MTDEEKDRKWQEVRDRVLANDAEYQQIVDGYKRGSIVNWIIIIGGAMVGSSLPDFLPVTSVVMKWILSIAAASWSLSSDCGYARCLSAGRPPRKLNARFGNGISEARILFSVATVGV